MPVGVSLSMVLFIHNALCMEKTVARREYPFGRVREDSVAQPIRNRAWAEACARLMERMTGESCDVVPRHNCCFYVLRLTGERWIRA